MNSTIKRIGMLALFHLSLYCMSVHAQVQLGEIFLEPPQSGLQAPRDESTELQAPVPPGTVEELPPAAVAVEDDLLGAIETSANPAVISELVIERYEDRKPKIEREVIQDQDQNYINHGKWKNYDRNGNVVVEGRYAHNEKDGVWTRIYYTRENELLNKAPFNQGQLPLISQANFKDGKLHGNWVIYDASPQKRRLSEWEFSHGKRDGRSTWWYASGMKMREISYTNGTIDGELNEWDRTGRQVTKDVYKEGSRLATKTEHYPDRAKRAEGTVLYPQLVLDTPDNWLECTLATYAQEGEPVKHGVWTSWYSNGQKKLEGEYNKDVPTGQFTWWHENGQRSLVANYRDGEKHGTWTWWHPSGLKSIQGEYANDTPINNWLWWEESGKVAQRADFNDPNQRNILATPASSSNQQSTPRSTRGRHVTIVK